eukprot:ANDGO_02682.mRNA.1 hypothetical protein
MVEIDGLAQKEDLVRQRQSVLCSSRAASTELMGRFDPEESVSLGSAQSHVDGLRTSLRSWAGVEQSVWRAFENDKEKERRQDEKESGRDQDRDRDREKVLLLEVEENRDRMRRNLVAERDRLMDDKHAKVMRVRQHLFDRVIQGLWMADDEREGRELLEKYSPSKSADQTRSPLAPAPAPASSSSSVGGDGPSQSNRKSEEEARKRDEEMRKLKREVEELRKMLREEQRMRKEAQSALIVSSSAESSGSATAVTSPRPASVAAQQPQPQQQQQQQQQQPQQAPAQLRKEDEEVVVVVQPEGVSPVVETASEPSTSAKWTMADAEASQEPQRTTEGIEEGPSSAVIPAEYAFTELDRSDLSVLQESIPVFVVLKGKASESYAAMDLFGEFSFTLYKENIKTAKKPSKVKKVLQFSFVGCVENACTIDVLRGIHHSPEYAKLVDKKTGGLKKITNARKEDCTPFALSLVFRDASAQVTNIVDIIPMSEEHAALISRAIPLALSYTQWYLASYQQHPRHHS